MASRILDTDLQARLIAERRRTGADRYDEVWEGEYVMSPLADNEHQQLAGNLTHIFRELLGSGEGVWCQPGANVSDQEVNWARNFRCPDVVVVLPGSRAQNRDTHWFGGPDFVVEIVSEGDATYENLGFYQKVGVRELLIVDRDPWALTLYRLAESGTLAVAGRVELPGESAVASEVLDCELTLGTRGGRRTLSVYHRATGRTWET